MQVLCLNFKPVVSRIEEETMLWSAFSVVFALFFALSQFPTILLSSKPCRLSVSHLRTLSTVVECFCLGNFKEGRY